MRAFRSGAPRQSAVGTGGFRGNYRWAERKRPAETGGPIL